MGFGLGLGLSKRARSGVLRTNLLPRSQEFDNASWTKTRAGISANASTDPLGGSLADKITEQTDTATSRSVGQSISVTSGTTYTLSVYALAAERSAINLRFAAGFAAGNVTFNLGAGTRTTTGTVAASAITDASGGWWRCSASFTATSTTTAGAQVFLSTGGTVSYDGVSGNGVYLFGAQAETGAVATAYIATAATTVSAP